jgi:rhodanese-related sulfurtransferase
VKQLFWEAVLVAGVGAALAFAANAISPRGLRLARDYFPAPPSRTNSPSVNSNLVTGSLGATNTQSALVKLTSRIRERGLEPIDINRARQLFNDPGYAQQLILFVDARDDDHYRQGHIPNAYQLDHYRPERHLSEILPACLVAQQIVVYCNGGDCEDSEFAALFLRDSASVPKEKLLVYVGGFTEWATNGLPVEIGERGSGQAPQNPR